MHIFEYKIGFSIEEFGQTVSQKITTKKLEGWLIKNSFKYEKVVVIEALKKTIPICLGAKYKNPSSMRIDAPDAFSCSSLISYLYTQSGVWMPSLSIDKYVFGVPVSKENLKFGDLIFSNTGSGLIRTQTVEYNPGTPVPEGVDHVGMYLGDNQVIHATKKRGKVLIENITEFTGNAKIIGFRRVADIDQERYVVSIFEDNPNLRKTVDLARVFNTATGSIMDKNLL